jgi:hypothetical protein
MTAAEPIDADALRIRHEFLTRPHLQLSAGAAAALLDLPLRYAVVILESLVRDRFLERSSDGRFTRASAAPDSRQPNL